MIIEIQTGDGLKKVRVCNYCRTACIPYGEFCSSSCYHKHLDAMIRQQQAEKERQLAELREWEANRNGR